MEKFCIKVSELEFIQSTQIWILPERPVLIPQIFLEVAMAGLGKVLGDWKHLLLLLPDHSIRVAS